MTLNQAFEYLTKYGGKHEAKMVLKEVVSPKSQVQSRKSKVESYRSFDFRLSTLDLFRVWRAARQLRRGMPVAKIIHRKWFYGLEFYTNHATLDPRPDSEVLVQAVLKSTVHSPQPTVSGLSCPPSGGGIDFVSGAGMRALQNLGWGVFPFKSPHPRVAVAHETVPPRNSIPPPDGGQENRSPISNLSSPISILDLGTGTGCLIAAIVKNLPGAVGVGIDKSRGAIRVARKNIQSLGLGDRVKIVRGDFCKDNSKFLQKILKRFFVIPAQAGTGLNSASQSDANHSCALRNLVARYARTFKPCSRLRGNDKLPLEVCQREQNDKFDVIVSNPPYIARGDRRVNRAAGFDPAIALYAGADGLDAYRAIARTAGAYLKPASDSSRDGKIFLEIGMGQGARVRKIFKSAGWRFVSAHQDLGGIERVLVFSL